MTTSPPAAAFTFEPGSVLITSFGRMEIATWCLPTIAPPVEDGPIAHNINPLFNEGLAAQACTCAVTSKLSHVFACAGGVHTVPMRCALKSPPAVVQGVALSRLL